MLAVLSACAVPASTPTAPGTPSESALIHRLTACLAPGQAKPTVVLVHGAWADTSSWRGETGTLQAAGYDVRAIANPLQNLTADSRYVRDYLQALRGPVVLAGHSYGGSVITNAAAGLANVKALVYVDAIAPAPGETTAQLSGAGSIITREKPSQLYFTTSYPGAPGGASELYLKENVFVNYFAGDLPRSRARLLWASQRGASTAAFTTPSTAAAWKTIPSWYFISTGDQIVTEASELKMAHRAHSHITMFRGGSHLTLISHPKPSPPSSHRRSAPGTDQTGLFESRATRNGAQARRAGPPGRRPAAAGGRQLAELKAQGAWGSNRERTD